MRERPEDDEQANGASDAQRPVLPGVPQHRPTKGLRRARRRRSADWGIRQWECNDRVGALCVVAGLLMPVAHEPRAEPRPLEASVDGKQRAVVAPEILEA